MTREDLLQHKRTWINKILPICEEYLSKEEKTIVRGILFVADEEDNLLSLVQASHLLTPIYNTVIAEENK